MRWHRQKAVLCIVAASSIGALAQQDEAWRRNVADTISATCAIRGLDLKAPLRVLPMDAFQGGYSPGIGSVTWEADHARMWREGWCALGVYCARDIASGGGGTSKRGFARPAGLYDPERNVLFVRDFTDASAAATIAHEAVHALQHQHFPALRAIHLWRNRDLAAAANSAIEGDAHVVGWSFDPARRTMLCSMDPERATSSHAKWWQWQPDGLSALEAFPHVFGTEPALREVLAHGQNGNGPHAARTAPVDACSATPRLGRHRHRLRSPTGATAARSLHARSTKHRGRRGDLGTAPAAR